MNTVQINAVISRNLQSAIQILLLWLRLAVMQFSREKLSIEKLRKLMSLFHAEFQVIAL